MEKWGEHLRLTPIGTFNEMSTVTVEDASYRIAGSEWMNVLSVDKCLALPDISFLAIHLDVRNNDNSPHSIQPFELIDENGASYNLSRKAACVNNDAISSEDLNPGTVKGLMAVYDVPQNHKYRVRVYGGDEYHQHNALILLNPKNAERQ
jgi:hypothetical protein